MTGVASEPWDDRRFQGHVSRRLDDHAGEVSPRSRAGLVARLRYLSGDVTEPDMMRAAVADAAGLVIAYLALPPAVFGPGLEALAAAGLGARTRVVVEKPFGTDLASARGLNQLLTRHFPERAVFRIDHFLGKQTVQNILGLRFANRLFEPLWCARHVERVDVMEGDPSLSIRGDEAEECWRIAEPILAAWRAGASPMGLYPAGSAGPTATWSPGTRHRGTPR